MNVSVRLFFGYFLIVGLAAWFVLTIFAKEAEPGVRQATEETLVDTAHVFAEMAALDLSNGHIQNGAFAEEWIEENHTGRARFNAARAADVEHKIEQVGRELRGMMPFVNPKTVNPGQ